MPTILGANSVSGYDIDNSIRFSPNDYISRYNGVGDESSNAGRIGTVSIWVKRGDTARTQGLFVVYEHNGQGYQTIWFNSDDTLQLAYEISGTEYQVKTNAKFRDPSAWYHVVAMTDTTQGTDSNRMKIYVNGTEQSYSSTAYPPQNTTLLWGKGSSTSYQYHIGRQRGVSSSSYAFFNGHIAEAHICMGQNYTASEFGETNNNGVWIPKEANVSYGTNGGFYEFKQTATGSASASTIGADTSGNGNHAGTGGLAAINITTDTPTNNFATLNSVADISRDVTFTEGNTRASIGNGSTNRAHATMGFTSGKWYWEVKYISTSTGASHLEIGFTDPIIGLRYHIRGNDGERWDNGSSSSGTDHRHDPDDIIGVYVDADNQKWYLQVNGSNSNGGNGAADVSEGTGFIHQNFAVTDFLLPYFANASSGNGHVFEVNFGNAPFAISSSNSDANGHGSFEYNPTNDGVNFYALNSKNLAEFG